MTSEQKHAANLVGLARDHEVLQPTKAERVGARVLRPFQVFVRRQASGGIVLLACAVLALVWANSPWADLRADAAHAARRLGSATACCASTSQHWINDGLMAIFFFVVGLEIKREVLVGELADRRTAALPVAAALGGMVVPALIYAAFNAGGAGAPAGASRWRPTSPSRSACWPCSARACPTA